MVHVRLPESRWLLAGICFWVLASTAGLADQDPAPGIPSNAPGATLLVPYFEVDLDAPDGRTTLISLRATSPEPALTHMTIWSDLGVPVLSFSIYLTGYDEQSLNMRDILVGGVLPQTAPNGFDSPVGDFSNAGPAPPACNSVLPPPNLNALTLNYLTGALTGNASPPFGLCFGQPYGDNIARGYVTIDVVSFCPQDFPGDPGYFISGGVGIASNDNVLRGEFMLADLSGSGELQFLPAVSLRALSDSATTTPGNPTFYGSLNFFDASDNREALPSRWRAPIDGPTDLIVWRGPRVPRNPFQCGTADLLSFEPGADRTVVSPRGNGEMLGLPADSPFPIVAQRVSLGRNSDFADTGFQIKPSGLLFNAEHSGEPNFQADQNYQQALIMSLGFPSGLPAGHYSSNAVPLQSAYDNPNFAN